MLGLIALLLLGRFGEMEKDEKFWSKKTLGWFVVATFFVLLGGFGGGKLDAAAGDPPAFALNFAMCVGIVFVLVRLTRIQNKKYPLAAGIWSLGYVTGCTLVLIQFIRWLG